VNSLARRSLHLHEYQSKDLLEKFGANVQTGKPATTPREAASVAAEILRSNPSAEIVVKAQIHAGGRGKGYFINSGYQGGVKILSNLVDVESAAAKMLGDHLVTKQTSAEGQKVETVLINESIDILEEVSEVERIATALRKLLRVIANALRIANTTRSGI